MDRGANSDSDYRSADEDVDSMPSVRIFNSDDDGVPPPSAHPSAAVDALPPPVEFGASEEKFNAPSGSVHKDAAAKDVPDASSDGSDSSNSSSMTRERSSLKRSREQKLARASRKARERTGERTAKHSKGRSSRAKPTPEPVAEFDSVQAQLNQLMKTVTDLVMTTQLNRRDMKADNEALNARMDGIQEKPAKHSQLLKPAEPATVAKDDVNESGPLSENVESSDSKDDSSSSARSRSSRHRHERYFNRRSTTKCPELLASEIHDMVVVTSWVGQVGRWAPGAEYNLVEFIRVLKLAFGPAGIRLAGSGHRNAHILCSRAQSAFAHPVGRLDRADGSNQSHTFQQLRAARRHGLSGPSAVAD